MRKLLSTLVLALIASLGLVATATPAQAAGGTFPSNAPVIGSGAALTGGSTKTNLSCCGSYWRQAGREGVQYYKVPMAFGDHLLVQFTNVTGSGTGVCVVAPTVTDFTVATSSCLEYEETPSTTQKAELQYIAPGDGQYLLAVFDSDGCSCSWAYSASVSISKETTVAATAKSKATVGHKIRVKGNASVAGSVTLQLKSGGWQNVATAATKPDGSFKLKYKPTKTGRAKFRVAFNGPVGYLPSLSGKVKVQVRR